MREHNRLVEGLRGVNPHWDAELLFEHARRIITAEFSHIIYNEFLPRLLSWNAVNLYGLKLLSSGKLYIFKNITIKLTHNINLYLLTYHKLFILQVTTKNIHQLVIQLL